MSRSLDQSRPFRAGRHRAETAPVISTPPTPTGSGAEMPHPAPTPAGAASAPLRRRRVRGPAFEVPPAPESSPKAQAASPATEVIAAVAPTTSALRSAAAPETTLRSRERREAAGKPAEAKPVAAPRSRPATAHSPQIASAFTSDAQAVLRKAASLRVMGHRMAVVTGALAVVLAVGTASQATELPFFGNESSAQDAPDAADAPHTTKGTLPTYSSGRAAPQPAASTPPGAPGAAPAEATPGTDDSQPGEDPGASALPAVADLPMPVDAPTLDGMLAASPATVPPSPAPTVVLEPPVTPSATPAAPTSSAGPAPAAPPTAPAPATSPTPTASSLPPSPTATATGGASEEAVDTRSYAIARLASYGWGAEQMNALNQLWDTSVKWRPSQVDRGLSYIKERHGSPAKALEFRATNNWY